MKRYAGTFSPGEFIKEELEARSWTRSYLAEIMGCPAWEVYDLIAGRKGITPEVAKALGKAFGTSADIWMRLGANYRPHTAITAVGEAKEDTDAE